MLVCAYECVGVPVTCGGGRDAPAVLPCLPAAPVGARGRLREHVWPRDAPGPLTPALQAL